MQKYKSTDVKPFSFSDLQGTKVVEQTKFRPFEFSALTGEAIDAQGISEEQIRQDRSHASKNDFLIDDAVRESRGISRQEKSDFEERVQVEVKRRIESLYQKAQQEGINLGREEGRKEALAGLMDGIEQKIQSLEQVIHEVQGQAGRVDQKNQMEIYEFVKRFTKWVILKEIDEKQYLERLLEKLILELNARKNLIVKVGRENFRQMPEVISLVESRIGQLQNVRVEIVPEIHHPGIILESENGLIDGSLESVLQNIDRIFEQVLGTGPVGHE